MNRARDLEALEPALENGWRLFPCVQRGKVPLLTDWPRRASSDADVISRWGEKHAGCNWGLATGAESGVFVIDVDGERGENSLRSLVEQHGTWEKTLTASTARGTHFYFRWPNTDTVIRNSASRIGASLDVRGRRGYTIIPPSIHPDGPRYLWTAMFPVAHAPGWLLETITSVSRPILDPVEFGILPEGQRNDGLTRFAGKLRRDGASQSEIESELIAANLRRCRPPLDAAEVSAIAASVARYAVGGLDPLESAWQASEGETCSQYERFLALARALQLARPDQAIALPLQRISELMRVHWNSVSYYRSKAVARGVLKPAGEYIPHRRAGLFRFVTKNLVTIGLVTKNPLVTKTEISPSYKAPENSHSSKAHFPLRCEAAK